MKTLDTELKAQSERPDKLDGPGSNDPHGISQAAEGHGRGIRHQAEQRGLQRWESEADQHGAGDGHGRSAAARALEQRAEREGDEEDLQAPVGRDATDGLLDDLELLGLHGDVVDKDGGHQDPGNAEPSVDQAIGYRAGGHVQRHVEDSESDGHADGEQIDGDEPGGGAVLVHLACRRDLFTPISLV